MGTAAVFDAIGSVATAGAFAVAVGVFVVNQRMRAEQQISEISAWTEPLPDGPNRLIAHVKNASTSLVYDVVIEVRAYDPEGREALSRRRLDLVKAGAHLGVAISWQAGSPVPPVPAPIAITLTESHGKRWRREAGGRLKRIRDGFIAPRSRDLHLHTPVMPNDPAGWGPIERFDE